MRRNVFIFALLAGVLAFQIRPAAGALQDPQARDVVRSVAAQLAQRFRVAILVEPGVASMRLRETPNANTVEASLAILARQAPGVSWVRVRPQSQPGAEKASPSKIAALVRSAQTMDRPTQFDDPGASRFLSLQPGSKQGIVSPSSPACYLLYRARVPAGAESEVDMSQLEEETMRLLETMSAESAPNPMRAWAEGLRGLNEQQMMRLVGPMAEAGLKLWGSTPSDVRGEMLKDSMTVAKTYGGGLMADPKGAPGQAAARNYLPELKREMDALAERTSARILVESDLFVNQPPAKTDPGSSIEEALTAALKKNADVVWRRVRFAGAAKEKVDPGKLATEVRLWESAGLETLALDGGEVKDFAMHAGSAPTGDSQPADVIYLVLGATAHGGKSPRARLEDLLKRQMEQMVRMSPDEVTAAMERAIGAYQGAGSGGGRERIMALPVMAGMMATWFPQAAKEGILKP